jgi:hypothetical protein
VEEINIWKGRIKECEGVQKEMHNEWNVAIDLYNCKYKDTMATIDSDRVEVNFANWYVTNLVPLLYFRDPYIFFKNETDSWEKFSNTLEKVVNSEWKRLELKEQFKDVILSGLLTSPGWIKEGYTAQIGQDEAKHEEIKQKSIITSIKDAILGNSKTDKNEELPEQKGVLDHHIKEESVFVSWVPSWNILIPPGYPRMRDLPYMIQAEKIAMRDFLDNPQYKNKNDLQMAYEAQKDSGGTRLQKVPYDSSGVPVDNYSELTTITLYHIWDRRSQKRMTLSMQGDDWHRTGDWPYDFDGFPFDDCMFEKTLPSQEKANPYPPNCIRPILPQILEQSNIRTQMSKWRKRSSAIVMAQRDMLSEEDMNQLENSDALQITYLSDIKGVVMTATPPLPNQVFEVGAEIQQDLQSATNMGQLMFAPQPGQRTATQAKMGAQGLQLKISAKQDVIEDLTVRIARKLAQLVWQFYDRDKVEEIIGEKVSEQMWPDLPEDKVERRRVIRSMKVFIDAGSAAPPKDETTDKKQLLDAVSIMSSIAPERLKKDEVLKSLIKKFKFEKDVDKLVITNDDEEIKCAQEENGFLQANHPCIVSPNNNHQIHLQEHAQANRTPALAQHILDHAKFAGLLPGKQGPGSETGGNGGPQGGQDGNKGPQKGDARPPMRSTNPEIVRQSTPTMGSVAGSAQNRGPNSVTAS